MHRSHPFKWWNIIGYAAVIVTNYLAMALPIGGRSTSAVSDMYPTLLTPAGYAFSIWALIYLLLAGFVIYQALPRGQSRESVQDIGVFFILSCLFNITWIFLWQNLYIELALIVMLLLLLSLIKIYRATRVSYPTSGEIWFVRLPFSLYLGWISVATILNVAIALEKNQWSGWGLSDSTWAVIVLCIGAALAILVSFPYRDSIYPLVFVWVYIAIAVEQRDTQSVYLAALILAALILIYSIWLLFARSQDRD